MPRKTNQSLKDPLNQFQQLRNLYKTIQLRIWWHHLCSLLSRIQNKETNCVKKEFKSNLLKTIDLTVKTLRERISRNKKTQSSGTARMMAREWCIRRKVIIWDLSRRMGISSLWRRKRSQKSKLHFQCRMLKMRRSLFQVLSLLHHKYHKTPMITTTRVATIIIIKTNTTSIKDQDMATRTITTIIETTTVDTMTSSSSTMTIRTNNSLGKTMFNTIGLSITKSNSSLTIKTTTTIRINIRVTTISNINSKILQRMLFIHLQTRNPLASIHDRTSNISLINRTSEAATWTSTIRLLFKTLDKRSSRILMHHFTQLLLPINLRFLLLKLNHLSQLVIQVLKNGTHKTIKILQVIKILGKMTKPKTLS